MHDQWGHNYRKRDKLFAKKLLGYELIGDEVYCYPCGIAKARRANVSKTISVGFRQDIILGYRNMPPNILALSYKFTK